MRLHIVIRAQEIGMVLLFEGRRGVCSRGGKHGRLGTRS